MGLRVWEGEREGGWGRGGPAHLDRSPALQDKAGERKPLGDGEHRDSADGRVAEAWVAFVLSTRNARNPSHRRRCRHRGPCDRQKGCFSFFFVCLSYLSTFECFNSCDFFSKEFFSFILRFGTTFCILFLKDSPAYFGFRPSNPEMSPPHEKLEPQGPRGGGAQGRTPGASSHVRWGHGHHVTP